MVINQIYKIVNQAFENCDYANDSILVKVSNRPELCDYQCDSAFNIAKAMRTNPKVVAENVVAEILALDKNQMFEKVEFANPGFINIVLSQKFINQNLQKMTSEYNFALQQPEQVETYFLDYGGPNIAKPLHVGHLRSAIVGESIKRLLQFVGHKTIADVHLGDIGLPIGTVIYGLIAEGYFNENLQVIKDLGDDSQILNLFETIYPKYSSLQKEDEEVYAKCAEITKQMQAGSTEYEKLRELVTRVSGNDILRIYEFLDVKFDLWEGESHAYQYIENVKSILESKELLIESQGAKVVDLTCLNSNPPTPPLIFEKSNGAYLYGTTDLATIYDRVQKFKPNHFLYLTDFRQALHFKQVFAVSQMAGITKNETLNHLWFGTVKGSDGKPFKTRSGNAPKLDDLFKQVEEEYIKAKAENANASREDLNKIVNAIIKFADLQNFYERDYVFDIEKFSNISGKTGPYILYGYLRIKKILENNNNLFASQFNDLVYGEEDKKLRLKLLQLQSAVKLAFAQKAPNIIAEYAYDLSVIMNNFYENNRINQEQDEIKKANWLKLLDLSTNVLKALLEILAIYIPSVM